MRFSRITYIFLAITIFVIDFLSKKWALHMCQEEWILTRWLSCETTLNTGLSWSLFHNFNQPVLVIGVGLIIGLLIWYAREQFLRKKIIIGEVMTITGALCNVLDRFIYGGVIDFIVLHYKQYMWPVFNIADIAICCGIFIMLIAARD